MLPGLCTQTSISVYDPKVYRPAESCDVSRIRVYSEHTIRVYPDTDVCMHSPGSIHCCDYVTEEAHRRVLLLLQQCVHIIVVCTAEF
jgi:hypothetical protein